MNKAERLAYEAGVKAALKSSAFAPRYQAALEQIRDALQTIEAINADFIDWTKENGGDTILMKTPYAGGIIGVIEGFTGSNGDKPTLKNSRFWDKLQTMWQDPSSYSGIAAASYIDDLINTGVPIEPKK